MASTIWLVAGAAFKESVRDRVPYSMVLFAVLLMSASFLINQLTAGQDVKIIKDLGLAAMSVFGLIIAVFIGIGLVSKEVERRSIFALLTKPVSRAQFVVGKYVGLVMTLLVNLGVMTTAYYALLLYMNFTALPEVRAAWPTPAADPRLLVAILLIVAELSLVTAVAIFFSTFSSPLLSALLTLAFWVSGHFNSDLRHFESVVAVPWAAWVAQALYFLLPNLSPFDIDAEIVYGVPVAWSHVGLTLVYAAVYVGAVLTGAVAVFRRRDFK